MLHLVQIFRPKQLWVPHTLAFPFRIENVTV